MIRNGDRILAIAVPATIYDSQYQSHHLSSYGIRTISY